MGKQLILVCGLGMENPPKFDFFLYFLLIHPKSDSAMTGASRYDNYSPQWGPLVHAREGGRVFPFSTLAAPFNDLVR